MNHTEYPSLNNTVAGFVFQKQEACETTDFDRRALEISCVDLISKLENQLAKAMQMPKDDFVDESAIVARKMLKLLLEFCDEFLVGKPGAQAKEEIDRALSFTDTYEEVLKTRSLKNAFIRAFWNVDESEEIQLSHAQLGEALVRGCAATFYHAVMRVGLDTPLGKQIDQSTVVFVNELKQSWK